MKIRLTIPIISSLSVLGIIEVVFGYFDFGLVG